ncbi:MAG: 16S rRNA (guanine(527)-N(7))-methyltransferase RsmG [Thermoleophilia bacterium]|nr:16S rRNA (guanine(527)-N(7))-methyltransferase RsmG [Thermoleophilia bacterium]
MRLAYTASYVALGLDAQAQSRLALLGDLICSAGFNVTGVTDPEQIERFHFLDALCLLTLEPVLWARSIVDIGSGGGLPGLVLALALPDALITAVESQGKKCAYIKRTASVLGLVNVAVCCQRAEECGRGPGREAHDVAVSRAVAALPVVAEYSLPLLRLGGVMVAMKGVISDQERIQAQKALGILGADGLGAVRLDPFVEAHDRWAYVARKTRATPEKYPRRAGLPAKRPLG